MGAGFAPHHSDHEERDHTHERIDQEEQNEDGVFHRIGLALAERLGAAGSAEKLDRDEGERFHARSVPEGTLKRSRIPAPLLRPRRPAEAGLATFLWRPGVAGVGDRVLRRVAAYRTMSCAVSSLMTP